MKGVLLAGAWTASSCAPSGFADETLVTTVRILASSSDPAYAQPGDTVTVQVLAVDGRPAQAQQAQPMSTYWIPFVMPFECVDPPNDAYFACFQELLGGDGGAAGGEDGGVASGLGALTGIPLNLPTGSSYAFSMPADVVTKHTPVPGEPSIVPTLTTVSDPPPT